MFYLYLFLILIFLFFIVVCVALTVTSTTYPEIAYHESENYFVDPTSQNSKHEFPSILDDASLTLSVVIPAYNEEKRLPVMLDECLTYLENRRKSQPEFDYELIVVNDGSKDNTTKVGHKYTEAYGTEKVRVLTLVKNRGKGGAVRYGALRTRGKYVLFADADGATKFSDLEKLEESMKDLYEKSDMVVVIGSRAHLEKDAVASRTFLRTILMYGFHFLVWFFGVQGIRDTQCGFKLFTRKAAAHLFCAIHVERWAFDVEVLYIAKKLKMPISEVAVNWKEIEGSKIIPVWSWLQMGKDLILIWLKYRIGAWKIAASPKSHLQN